MFFRSLLLLLRQRVGQRRVQQIRHRSAVSDWYVLSAADVHSKNTRLIVDMNCSTRASICNIQLVSPYSFLSITRNHVLSFNAHYGLLRSQRPGGQKMCGPVGVHGRRRRLFGSRRTTGETKEIIHARTLRTTDARWTDNFICPTIH